MALARLARQAKRPFGLCAKMTAVGILGLCFIFVWSIFSSPSSSVTTQRESFDDIAEPASSRSRSTLPPVNDNTWNRPSRSKVLESNATDQIDKKANGAVSSVGNEDHRNQHHTSTSAKKQLPALEETNGNGQEEEDNSGIEDEQGQVIDGKEETDVNGDDSVLVSDEEDVEKVERKKKKATKFKGPVFDPKGQYSWRLCHTRSKFNYIPCIDMETVNINGKMQSYRHTERSCPRTPLMCLVPLPHEGYASPVRWPESKLKVLYKNVGHPKLAVFVNRRTWVVHSGEYLTFPQNQTQFKGGVQHYLDFIEEMVPDIEWGKNIRLVMDVGCSDSSFAASLIDKDVLTLSLGLKDDLVDIAQVSLERGFPAIVSPFGSRRLPFPSGVFDVIHCFSCGIPWHSNEGKSLLEMNRLMRPGGYFILSSKHDNIEVEEGLVCIS